MINLLVGAIPGIVAALAVWLAAVGIRAWRYDPVQDVHPEELMDASVLGASQEKTKASVLSRLGARFVPLIKGSLPASIPRRLQRQIDLAGRPPGMTVDGVMAQQVGLLIVAIPVSFLYIRSGFVLWVIPLVGLAVMWPMIRLTTLARRRRAPGTVPSPGPSRARLFSCHNSAKASAQLSTRPAPWQTWRETSRPASGSVQLPQILISMPR